MRTQRPPDVYPWRLAVAQRAHAGIGWSGYNRDTEALRKPWSVPDRFAGIGAGVIAEGMESTVVPTAEYAKFTHRGAASKLDSTVNYVYSSWLLSSGKRHTGGPDLEFYGEEYHPTSADSVIYYAIPVR